VEGTVTGRRARGLLVAIVGASLALGGCGGGTQSKPEKLGREDVPFGLLDRATSTTPPTTVPPAIYSYFVWFVGPDGTVPAVRSASVRPAPGVVGKALLAGPTPQELQLKIHSAIPPRSVGRFGKVSNGTVTIDLDRPFLDVSGPTQKLALTQLVYTMTALRGVRQVRFLLDGRRTTVPRLNGTITSGPVRRTDYEPSASG